jgi:hypothetical protein
MRKQKSRSYLFIGVLSGLFAIALGHELAPVVAQDHRGPQAKPDEFDRAIRPLLKKYCYECHGPGDIEDTKLDLQRFHSTDMVHREPERWAKVLERLESKEMPPEDAPILPDLSRQILKKWAKSAVKDGRKKLAGDPGRVTLRRLNKAEYNYTVQDLFGVSMSPADEFPDDDVGYGFDTVGDVLSIPPLLIERYLDAAEKVAAAAIRDFQPVSMRWKAIDTKRDGRGGNWGGVGHLSTNGSFSKKTKLFWNGKYKFRARVYGQQAGKERVRMAMRIDGRTVAIKTVPNEARNPGVFEATIQLTGGSHEFAIAFLNDFWDPKAKRKRDRDRNMVVDWFEVKGPLEKPFLTQFERFVDGFGSPGIKSRWSDHAGQILGRLARRVYRRPVSKGELGKILSFFNTAVKDGGSFEKGLQSAMTFLLVSPHFIFRAEIDKEPTNEKAIHRLTDHELATRLSYFLWCSVPDGELDQLADKGQLREQWTKQVLRMLDDPRSSRFVEQFAGQWLQLRRLSTASPDPDSFPRFDNALLKAMRIESEMFFDSLLRENRSVLDLLDARYTFVNGRLAKHYGIPGVTGSRWRRVRTASGRAGILGHASILTLSSNPTRSSPVKRGKWILETLLDDPPPPPLPGTDSLAPLGKGQEKRSMTMRERFELHREKKSCAVCHDRLDPLGFALENFDGIGGWRTSMNGKKVDVSARLPGGNSFSGLTGLRDTLRIKKEKIVRGLVRNLLVYGIGRGTLPSDAAVLDSIVQKAGPDYRFIDLIVAIVKSDAFQKRRGEKETRKKRW